jgi:hypothetical protein
MNPSSTKLTDADVTVNRLRRTFPNLGIVRMAEQPDSTGSAFLCMTRSSQLSIYTSNGSSSISVIKWQHSRPHKFWAGPAIHGSLQCLETIDLSFGLSVAPKELDCILDGIDILCTKKSEADG